MRLLLASNPPNPAPAIAYARTCLSPLFTTYGNDISRLLGCLAYLPLTKLLQSPYADLASPSLHLDLEPLFAKEYCASLGMSRQVPLRVVGDIGGGGALARIEKGRKVMRERKSEWSQTDELPVRLTFYSSCDVVLTGGYTRLRYHCHLRIGIIQYLHVLFPKSRLHQQTRP